MSWLASFVCAFALILSYAPAAAQTDAVFDLLGRINLLRRQNGLAPLELNDQLLASAQRHSQDMANTGNIDHTGSDGSTSEQRIRESGYGPSLLAWGENIYGGGIAGVDDAWGFWTTSTVHRNNLLSERYREIGIGVVGNSNGTYYTLDFGARSGVLPFFVDQGGSLSDPSVTLTLSNEEAASGGSMGRAVEVRVGEGEDLNAIVWQAWQRSIPFTLSSVGGQHRITVEYRDAGGIVASYFRIVTLIAPNQPTSQPSIQPTSTSTRTPVPTSTSAPTDTPTLVPPSATFTSIPSATLTAAPSPTSQPTRHPTNRPTSLPAVTPLPSAAPVDRSPLEALLSRGWADAPGDLLGWAIGLPLAAVVIGAVILIRRSAKS